MNPGKQAPDKSVSGKIDWQQLSRALRDVHAALLARARRDYEREHGALSAGELLQAVTTDPAFAWLRSLSELMVEVDEIRDAEPAVGHEMAASVRTLIEGLVGGPGDDAHAPAFAHRYLGYLQDEPQVAIAHGHLKRTLAAWPRAKGAVDRARWLDEQRKRAQAARRKR
jgi:hypothetical protein